MEQDKIKKLCEYIDSNRGKNYPIYNELLDEETDYIKNSYFKMLAVILQQSKEITESQRNLFIRLIAGVSCDYTMADYLRQALEIEIQDYVDFTGQYGVMPIRYRFIFDALLLTALQQKNEEQLRLVADFADSLEIKQEEMKYMALLAQNILALNIDFYDIMENNYLAIPVEVLEDYTDLILGKYLYNDDNTVVIHGDFLNDISFEKLFAFLDDQAPNLVISNVTLNLSQFKLCLTDFDTVIFEHCIFDKGSFPIYFTNCHSVEIRSCIFKNFTTHVLIENNIAKMKLSNTTFQNCIYSYCRQSDDWLEMGCTIYTDDTNSNGRNHFNNCKFIDCIGKNTANYYTAAFLSNCPSDLIECSFENCWHYNQNSSLDPECTDRRMFTENSSAVRCSIINSANIT